MTTENPTRNDFIQAGQRCAAAYHHVIVDMPKNPTRWEDAEIHQKAFFAYAAELPILCDPASFQLYITCISQGASIGAIDPVDVGRFCHIANTAMSAWKLANLIVPAAQMKEEREQKKAEERSTRAVPTDRSSSVGWSTPLPPRR